MEMYLQTGSGMMTITRELIDIWGSASVILSPRDLNPDQITRFPNEIAGSLDECLIDPQFYLPRADYHTLNDHDYWPTDYSTNMLYDGIEENLHELKRLNDSALTTKYILPSILCTEVDDVWIRHNNQILDLSQKIFSGKPQIATLPLVQEVVRDEASLEKLLNIVENWEVDGFYVVAEPPENQYLVDDPLWLSNLLNFISGLKLLDKHVVLGYANHQMLCASLTNIDAIASGTWLNVRSFPPDKFNQSDDEVRRRALWYYCPHTFSEYKIQFVETAFRDDIIDKLKPERDYLDQFVRPLFSGALPSDTNYSESNSHRHYLNTLKKQVDKLNFDSFSDAYETYKNTLDEYQDNSDELASEGVLGQHRDFNEIFDVNLNAIISLKKKRGFVLERKWDAQDVN